MDYNKIVLFSDLDGTLFDSSTAVPEINRRRYSTLRSRAAFSASAPAAPSTTPRPIWKRWP